ncbi:type IV pilin [Halopenitus sp. H-Gu1]|uniref:type IV pilin n=1 Tax=Halopenitus sp. H-Gu1 TaxID=3242697 RepID=UPI00359CCE25
MPISTDSMLGVTGSDRAASSPIGVVLMVGLTVIIAGVLATMVLGIDITVIADRVADLIDDGYY